MTFIAEIKKYFGEGLEKREEHRGSDDTWVRPYRTWAKRREEARRAEEEAGEAQEAFKEISQKSWKKECMMEENVM